MSKKNLSEELKQKIVSDWISDKKTVAQLADEYGCSEQSIRNWAKKKITDTPVCDKTSSQLVGENLNSQIYIHANRLSEPMFYSLTDAAVSIKINQNQLVKYASLGKIPIYVENTEGYYLIDRVQLDDLAQYYNPKNWMNWSANTSRYYGSCRVPLLLSLELSDYQHIYLCGVIHKGKFSRIATKEYVSHGETKELTLKWKEPQSTDIRESFGIGNFFYPFHEKDIPTLDSEAYKGDRVRRIRINADNLRVLAKDLKSLLEQELKTIHPQQQSQELFQRHDNKSSLLVDLDKAAFDFYGAFNPIKAAHYDTKEKISTYLMERFGFFKIHADVAAEVILPSSDNLIEEDHQGKYRTRLLQLLIQAWNELCTHTEFKKVNKTSYEIAAQAWFTDKFKHKLSLADNKRRFLAKIILPDNASLS